MKCSLKLKKYWRTCLLQYFHNVIVRVKIVWTLISIETHRIITVLHFFFYNFLSSPFPSLRSGCCSVQTTDSAAITLIVLFSVNRFKPFWQMDIAVAQRSSSPSAVADWLFRMTYTRFQSIRKRYSQPQMFKHVSKMKNIISATGIVCLNVTVGLFT